MAAFRAPVQVRSTENKDHPYFHLFCRSGTNTHGGTTRCWDLCADRFVHHAGAGSGEDPNPQFMARSNMPDLPTGLSGTPDQYSDWILDMAAEGLEVLRTPWNALVLVDRAPLDGLGCGTDLDQKGLHGLKGGGLTLVGEIEQVTEDVMHGVHSGMVGGVAVLVDQYVQCINGMPRIVVRVVTASNDAPKCGALDLDRFVMKLIRTN